MRNSWQTWPVDLKWNILLYWGDENRSVWSDWWFFLKTTKRKIKDIVFYLVLQSYYLSNSYVWKLELNANCIFYILSRLHVCRLPWFTWPSPPPFGWGQDLLHWKERKKERRCCVSFSSRVWSKWADIRSPCTLPDTARCSDDGWDVTKALRPAQASGCHVQPTFIFGHIKGEIFG